MPKKTKKVEEHLQSIEFLLAAILLKREADFKKVCKVIGCSDKTFTKMFPERKREKPTNKKMI